MSDARQVGSYGDPGRDPRGWTVTVAYAAVVPSIELGVKAAVSAQGAELGVLHWATQHRGAPEGNRRQPGVLCTVFPGGGGPEAVACVAVPAPEEGG